MTSPTTLYWEDVEMGMEVPPLHKCTNHMQLVKYAGAEEDWAEFHVNDAYAKSIGLPGAIDHGLLKAAFLGQLLTDWIGVEGSIKKLGCQYRRMTFPGDPMVCRGKVTDKYIQDGEHRVDLEVWTENSKGEVTTPGHATVVLPTKNT